MNIPLPPTDNLYKFLAIFGLIVVIFSVAFPQVLSFDLKKQISTLKAEVIVLEGDVDRHGSGATSDAGIEQLRQRKAEAERRLMIIEGLTGQIAALEAYMLLGVFVGASTMVVGFAFWYFRVQRYQDRILREDSEKRKTARTRGKAAAADSYR